MDQRRRPTPATSPPPHTATPRGGDLGTSVALRGGELGNWVALRGARGNLDGPSWWSAGDRDGPPWWLRCARGAPQRRWPVGQAAATAALRNVYRAADRVWQYMIRDVCYHGEQCSAEDRLFQITAFRTFSRIETSRSVRAILGRYPTLDDLADGSFAKALDDIRVSNGGLYTVSFILCATDADGQQAKHRNHVELFRHMLLHRLGAKPLDAGSCASSGAR